MGGDVEPAQLHLLPPLAGQVDEDGQGEYDGEPAGGSAEPQHSPDVWHEDCKEDANGDDGPVQSKNVRQTWNYNSVKYSRNKCYKERPDMSNSYNSVNSPDT